MKRPRILKYIKPKKQFYGEPIWLKALPWIKIAIEVNKLHRRFYGNP
jgi:hypothetical protein